MCPLLKDKTLLSNFYGSKNDHFIERDLFVIEKCPSVLLINYKNAGISINVFVEYQSQSISVARRSIDRQVSLFIILTRFVNNTSMGVMSPSLKPLYCIKKQEQTFFIQVVISLIIQLIYFSFSVKPLQSALSSMSYVCGCGNSQTQQKSTSAVWYTFFFTIYRSIVFFSHLQL